MATITALNIYPVKSCRGIALTRATLEPTGFTHDRQWLIVRPNGQFITQREDARLAAIETTVADGLLTLRAPNVAALSVPANVNAGSMEVRIWKDTCAAFDAGEAVARWLEACLDKPYRLARFDPSRTRCSDRKWTGDVSASAQFSDGFPYLVISQASLDDLNRRLPRPLPMNRFRPNIVVDGLPAYGEDDVFEFAADAARLRVVKPCLRCIITTTDQECAERDGDEPLRTLRGYRFNKQMQGVMFGQNVILVEGAGRELRVGQELGVTLGAT